MLPVQLYESLIVFLLKILEYLCDFGKCLLSALKKSLQTFVDTARLKGGLNQIMLRFLFLFFLVVLVVGLKVNVVV